MGRAFGDEWQKMVERRSECQGCVVNTVQVEESVGSILLEASASAFGTFCVGMIPISMCVDCSHDCRKGQPRGCNCL